MLARMMDRAEERGNREHRGEVLAGISGRVIEIGAGTGLNFDHYPSTVEEVVATEPEPYLRQLATKAALRASVPVRVVDWTAEELNTEDTSFDAGVASLVLCSVGDPKRAVEELFRVIRPGGELRYYEHVLAESPALAALQRTLDSVGLPRLIGGDHMGRRTYAEIRAAGFAVEAERRFRFYPQPFNVFISPHVLGRARRPLAGSRRSS
jgi:ubiquinone/menaquinone biosynthesis C-methylase UbiE